MGELMDDWRNKKTEEAIALHERLRAAVLTKRVQIYTDQRMLDFQGSPVHNGWDHLMPLMVMMVVALVILLATGVAFGIVAMTIGALAHLLGIKHFIAWRIRTRATAYMLESAHHWHQLWHLGGIAIYMPESNEPPCLAPRGDWRRFAKRNLSDDPQAAQAADQDEPEDAPEGEVLPP
ncbi:hypothetical protein [Magnetospirillum sp. 64-120]|uniref:hypothetical protein n=1 Tax=Magnetospirillum sp. 64-120 TaxID=1895778 RepID=UPI00092BFC40|nr:hypothetical protein [Magnetospirillum sp. 64-120]OJX68081.1 MAG: hypothetical protein BGO92_05320 [Magnetospirillum sp. 64-120]